MRTKLLLIFSIVFLTIDICAQNLHFEHLNEQKGLNQINILSLHQGPLGYIWIGTYYGLIRYDGHEFEKVITLEGGVEESSILSISSNLNQVVAISKKRLFFIDKNSLEVQNIEFPVNKIRKPKKLIALRNSILIAAEDGLWRMKMGSSFFENIHPGSPVTDMQSIATGKVIYSNSEGFYTYYPFNQAKKSIAYKPNSLIKHIWIDANQELAWIEANNEFRTATLKHQKIKVHKSFEIPETPASYCLLKYNKSFYVGTRKGLLEISNNGLTKYLQQDEDDYYSLSQNFVSCLLVDNTNNLWVGTEIGGLNLHNPERYKFPLASYLLHTNLSKCKEVLSFAETQTGDILWQSTMGVIGTFDPRNNRVKSILNTGFIGNCMVAETAYPNEFLIGTPDGIFSYNLNTKKITFLSSSNPIKNFESDVKCILPMGDGTYWMCGKDGLFLYHARKKETLAFYNIANSTLGTDNIRSVNFKSKNELLVATSKGLYVFNTLKQRFTLFELSKDKKEPMIPVAKTDTKGNVWIATAGKGVFVWQANGSTIQIDKPQGLSDNQIYSLTFNESQTQCWVATNNGLSCIDTKNYTIKNYYAHNGLQPSEFIEASAFKTKDGSLYFGGVAGFNYFKPAHISNENMASKIAIKSLSVLNQKQAFQAFYKIPSSKNYISFEYAALDYNLSENQTYCYTIEGLDTGYNEVGNRRFASFGQLAPGTYQFKVKAKGPNGNISQNEASVSFEIVPNFYQTNWFKILSSILLAAFIAYIIYTRTQRAIEEEKEKGIQSNMIALLELKALRAQMNPHFIFNSLNSIQFFVMNNEGKEAAKYLSKFAKLIRMILDISEQTFISISSKIEFLKLYVDLEALRLNNSFKAEFWIDPNLDQSILMPTLLIQPHIENAIWHGLQSKQGKKTLLIRFVHLNDETLQVIVEDNGIGRQAAMEIKKQKINLHQSKGTKISEDRINLLNKLFGSNPKIEIIDLFDENNLACGTKVIINVPIIHG